MGKIERVTVPESEPHTCCYGSDGAVPDSTAASGKNLLPFYGILIDKIANKGDPTITDPGVATDGHNLDTIRMAVPGEASEK